MFSGRFNKVLIVVSLSMCSGTVKTFNCMCWRLKATVFGQHLLWRIISSVPVHLGDLTSGKCNCLSYVWDCLFQFKFNLTIASVSYSTALNECLCSTLPDTALTHNFMLVESECWGERVQYIHNSLWNAMLYRRNFLNTKVKIKTAAQPLL